ncbi:uncharacterized protein DUF4395 [Sediminihabitans luteus]|uniref:Uncharacterized protein DUF4395 n=1 Tax=Sediminihabitans luteus TaxID=1138585 RepID=A0A2M9CEL9_9CELL|nr:DUF4395 domain-containing protein [Sediminihabitans luteus]PJJ70300.1 uncharacterized protein DUF4395 [Sediminihabitans luteus]GII97771.1 membrane protein [Sediminihabitans luteus]
MTPETPDVTGAPTRDVPVIDVRGPRFGAAVTALLLAVVLVLGASVGGLVVLAVVAAGFAVGAVRGAQHTWQGWVFAHWVRPRLAASDEVEDARPPRFAQQVGFAITGVGAVLGAFGVLAAVPVAAAVALVAALLNAVFGLCLGCELYVLLGRLRGARRA